MLLSRWFRRADREGARRARPARASFRPNLESLDGRDVPSASPAVATHFLVLTPHTATAGVASPFEVVALDACEVRVIDGVHVQRLIESVPGFGTRFYRMLALQLAQEIRGGAGLRTALAALT